MAEDRPNKFAIVHCESEEEDEDHYHTGPVLSAGFDVVRVAFCDDSGGWEPEVCEIDPTEITRISFDTPYIRTFSKYPNGPHPHTP